MKKAAAKSPTRRTAGRKTGGRASPSGPGERLPELRRELRAAEARILSARRESRDYARRLAAAQASLSRNRLRLQSKVELREVQLGEKVKRLSILYEVGQALGATLELDRLLSLIVKQAARHLKARKASLMLIEGDKEEMRINSSVGIRRWIVEKTRIKIGEGIAGTVARTGEAVRIENIATDKRFHRPSRGTYRTGSFLSVPIRRQEKILGVLNVSDKRSRNPFDADDFNLVTTLAAQAAIAVENATLYQSLKEKMVSLEELYRLREGERRQLLTLINSITDGILAVDLAGRPLFVNEKAKKLLGLEAGPPDDGLMKDMLPSSDLGRTIREGMEMALSAAVSRKETAFDQGRGEEGYLEIVSVPIRERSGAMVGALTLARDITEFKELDQARDDFMNRASHQLKTPVGLIAGFTDTLLKHPGLEEGRRNRFLGLVHAEADRLAGLIETLLDFTRIESKMLRVERERVSPGELIRGLMPAAEARAAEKEITLSASLEGNLPIMEIDPTCFKEAVRNILDNSLKFTPRNGSIAVTVRPRGDNLEVTVRDTGPGIDESALPHIFDKFYVGPSSGAAGTGLGLYIAKEMIGALGGSIAVSSRPEGGSTFIVTIPLSSPGLKA